MRKMTALTMLALLALTTAFALMGCGQKSQETTTTEQAPPPETTMPESTMTDTSMGH
jgi:uncharacterized lipoprotein YehR (DUF1307 family)